ncbi:(d)CMP kinase [Pelosinus sp. sgz500959]|uniref:(d)CMP kinase n=1 Tax=Pelosinus sp. sgz500959 TaxID=3242472 RepID=UPI00366C1F64
MKKIIIAIDGPAGAGKSTVAQIVAQRLQYVYIDTGAMYRCIAWKVLQDGLTADDEAAIVDIARNISIKLMYIDGKTQVFVDKCDVTNAIRNPEVSRMVPEVAQFAVVREAMVALQRQMAEQGGVVMDGRDIGTHVLPNAEVKIFLTASIEERAQRRWRELTDKGFSVSLEELTSEIADRDKKDCEREISPLIQATDAILMDTTALSIEQAVSEILAICKER